jgi:hypothetical protein
MVRQVDFFFLVFPGSEEIAIEHIIYPECGKPAGICSSDEFIPCLYIGIMAVFG